MNKLYKSIWNETTQTWVAAPEIARRGGQGSASEAVGTKPAAARGTAGAPWHHARLRGLSVSLALVAMAGMAATAPAWAGGPAPNQLPQGGQVAAGSAQIGVNGNTMNVDQSTQRAIINWHSFDVGSAATVNFNQPGAASVTLNRVQSTNPSQIFGKVNANGQVVLANPAGVYFSPSASVNVGGLVATTSKIDDADFMAGKMNFSGDGGGAVINEGELKAHLGGYIALLAPQVRNSGVVVAQMGTVAMAAGQAYVLQFQGRGLAGITVTPSQLKTLVDNRHAVQAPGGLVILSAQSVNQLQGSVVNSASVEATSLTSVGGKIVLDGGDITLAAGSSLKADGAAGGGQVLVGGEGKDVSGDMRQARRVTMDADATISANATGQGDGGRVILWSDTKDAGTKTAAHGRISARGAGAGGKGGFVETSGGQVDFNGVRVDTSAAQGATGTWLTDPFDLTVDAAAASTISTNLATTNVTLQTTATGASGPGTQNASGSGDINVNSAVNWGSANTFTLDAYRNVNINAAVTATGAGKVAIITGDTAGNGTSTGGDYGFGLSDAGFAGRISFTGAAGSGQALSINGAAYTLIHALPGTAAVTTLAAGNYALANSLTDTVTRTDGVYAPGANLVNFTGLGNTVGGLNISGSTTTGTGFFRTVAATAGSTIRDIGLTSGTVTATAGSNVGGLIGAATNATVKNSYANLGVTSSSGSAGNVGGLIGGATSVKVDNVFTGGTVSTTFAGGNSQVGGLIGNLTASGTAATVTNAHSSANVSAGGAYSGGLVGRVTGVSAAASVSISNSYATGTVTSTGTYVGGLLGAMEGSYTTVSNTYATGQVTGTTDVGGLVGRALGTTAQNLTDSYASGQVNGTTGVGGLVGEVSGTGVAVTSVRATGNVTGSSTTVGGLIGNSVNGTVSKAYATGNVSGTTSVGGFVGAMNGTTINTSFATGDVTGTAGNIGGFAGVAQNYSVITDAYALGNVHATAAMSPTTNGVGGFLGTSRGGASTAAPLTLTNIHAAGTVTSDVATTNIGGLLGNVYNGYTLVTNGYWDATTTGQAGIGANTAGVVRYAYGTDLAAWANNTTGTTTTGARTTAQMTDGTMPAGFNSASSANGNPWRTGNGLYPYFALPGYVPDGAQLISGIAYGTNGLPAGLSSISIYFGGGVLASGVTADATTGYYSTFVGAGTIGASSKLGGTLTLNGAGSVSGASYTDAPTLSGGNVVGFDIKSGLYLSTTSATGYTALLADHDATFGSGTASTLRSTLAGNWWQINAAGNFSVDSALSHAGGTGLAAGGNLALNAALTATGNTIALKAAGTVTDGASGAVTAANLVLLGGDVTLDGSSNDVTTVAASGVAGLRYTDMNTVTVGSVGPYTTGITAASINGSTATTAGIAAGGDIAIEARAGNVNLNSNLASSLAGATILAKATTDITQASGVSVTSNGGAVTYWADSDADTTNYGRIRLNENSSIATGGGNVTLGGGLDLATGYATYKAVGLAGSNESILTIAGVTLRNANINAGSGNVVMRGQSVGPDQNFSHGISIRGDGGAAAVTGGTITLEGISNNTATGTLGSSDRGISVTAASGGSASVIGQGAVTLTGTGSAGTGGNGYNNVGIVVNGGTVASTGASVTLTGTGRSTGGGNHGISLLAGADVHAATTVALTGSASTTATLANIGVAIDGSATKVYSNGSGAPGATTITGTRGGSNASSVGIALTNGATLGGAGKSGDITLRANEFTFSGPPVINTSGAVVAESTSASFSTGLNWSTTLLGGPSSLRLGKTGNTADVTVSSAQSVAGPIEIHAGSIALNESLSSTAGTGRITLDASVAATQGAGTLSADQLLLTGPGSFSLNQAGNAVNTLAAGAGGAAVGSVSYTNAGALTIGTVGSNSGMTSSGTISVATLNGDLTLAQSVATSDTSASAITLNAGQSAAAGTASGGNIVVSGSPSVTTGTGGRATLYSGSATGDTTLAGLVGSGSGRFRYNSDEAAANYTAALGTGVYGIYRETVNTAFALDSVSTVYGSAPSLNSSSGLVNGDTATVDVSNPLLSSSGNYRVGSYGISVTNVADLAALGYTVTGNSTGTLTVTPKAVTVSGITANDKVYDGTTAATVNSGGAVVNGLVAGDTVTVSATGSFDTKNVGTGKTVTLSSSEGGADAGNYSFTRQASTTASVTPKAVTVSGITADDKVYDGTTAATVNSGGAVVNGLVAGDTVTVSATGTFDTKNVGTGKTVTLSSTEGGADAGNYSFTRQASTTASVTPKAVTVSGITADDKVYDGTTAATVNSGGAVVNGLVAGDTVTVSATGSFDTKNVGTGKTVTLSSTEGGADAGNYSFTRQASTTASVTPKAVTVSGITADDKVYDGTTAATVNSGGAVVNGLVAGDTVTVSATGSFDTKNVGTGKTVTLSSSEGGADAGNYSFTRQASTTASVTPKAVTVSGITADDKVYDGTTAATVNSGGAVVNGLVAGDTVTVSATGNFDTKNVGTGKTVTLSSTEGGADAGNYSFTRQASTTASVTPKAVTVSGITADDKVYDGTTAATVNSGSAVVNGLVAGDTVTVSATGTFDTKNVGTGKTVTLSSTEGGADAGNYSFIRQASTTASVTPKAATVSGITADDKVYDGTTAATVNSGSAVVNGLVAGDTVTVSATGSFDTKNVGTGKTVTLSSTEGGADAGNYSFTRQASTTASITPKALIVSGATADDKVYDGNTTATVNAGTVDGIVAGDVVSLAGAFDTKNVGNGKTVTLSSAGTDGGNYTLTSQTTTQADITPKAVTISGITADDKVYDGTTAATTNGGVIDGLVAGDTVTLNVTGAFDTKNVGAGKTVTLSSTEGGADAGNYSFTRQASTTASITPKALIVSGATADDKVYDGNTTATVNAGTVDGVVAGDVVNLAGTFDTKNVGNGKTVTLSSAGTDGGNYTLTSQTTAQADITPKAVTVSGITANDKVYDGTTAATTNGGVIDGLVAGDTVTLNVTGAFDTKNVGAGKTVTLSSTEGGADAGNYSFTRQASTTASITPKALIVSGATADDKVYDGNTTATVNAGTVDGVVAGDVVNLAGTFDTKNVGNGKTVTLSSAGTDGGNYTLTSQTTAQADITPKAVTVSGITANDKVYDGTTAATTNGGVIDGLVAGDTVTLNVTGAFDTKNVGAGKTVTLSSTEGGADAGNYSFTRQASTTASITPKALIVSARPPTTRSTTATRRLRSTRAP